MIKEEYNRLDVPIIYNVDSWLPRFRIYVAKHNIPTKKWIDTLYKIEWVEKIQLDQDIKPIYRDSRIEYKRFPKFNSECLVHTWALIWKDEKIISLLEYWANL